MVGDSPSNDVAFGRAAGARTALLDSGRRVAVEGGADGGADVVVDTLAALPGEIWVRGFVSRLPRQGVVLCHVKSGGKTVGRPGPQ